MSPQETIKGLLLSDRELTGLDAGVVDPQERVDVVHGLCPDVGKLLYLGSSIFDFIVR